MKITSLAICGSDLHLYQGNFPLPIGIVIGHEPMGIKEEVESEVTDVKKGFLKPIREQSDFCSLISHLSY